MRSTVHAATWFDASRDPSMLMDASYVFGGAHLLKEFFTKAASLSAEVHLLIVTPFLDVDVLNQLSVFNDEHVRRIDLMLLTTPHYSRSAAAQHIARLPWRACEIRALKGLHAKVYMASSATDLPRIAMIGSHNLTSAGAFRNIEAGVLISGNHREAADVLVALAHHVMALKARSHVVHDSLSVLPSCAPAA